MSSIPEKSTLVATAKKIQFRTRAFIDGRFSDAASGKTYAAENPATGQMLANIAQCDAADVDRAVKVARKTADSGVWSRMSPAGRKKILVKFADLIDANTLELALTESLDAGKPISDCLNIDIPETAICFRWHAEAVDKLYDQVAPTGQENVALIVREPVGVVGAVIPWNYPALMAAWKLGPALATGNCVVIKPAKQTSLSLLRLAELACEAGLPSGVLNVVPGPGECVGEAIGRHPEVDAVAFTGSTEIGRRFLQFFRIESQAGDARTGREKSASGAGRRCESGPRGRARRQRRLLEHGRELQRGNAVDRGSEDQRCLAGETSRRYEAMDRRRSARSFHAHWADDRQGTHGTRALVHSSGPR